METEIRITKRPTWKSLVSAFKLAGRHVTPAYEGYYSGTRPAPRDSNYYPNIIRILGMTDLPSTELPTIFLSCQFTESESLLVFSLFWRTDMGSVLHEPLLRGIDHELYWHLFPRDLNWKPLETNRINGFGGFFSDPLCNPSYGAWRYPWLFDHFESRRLDQNAKNWRRVQQAPLEERRQYALHTSWEFGKCTPPRRDSGYFEPFEVAWRTVRDNYYAWLPTAPEWHRAYYEWGLDRANRCWGWAVDGMWSDDSANPVEDYVARVGQHRRRVNPDEVLAAATETMNHHGFLASVDAPTVGRPDTWLDARWAEEAQLGEHATRFLLRTNAEFVDCDTAHIHLEVVVADTLQGKTMVVWIPRPDGAYGRLWTSAPFNLQLRMVLRDVDDRLGGDTRCPLNARKWSGNPVMEYHPVYKYRFSPSPTDQAPHVLKE